MTLALLLQHSAEAWLLLGLVGSVIEFIGERKNWPALVKLGQRLEAASLDLPKLWRGSRMSNAVRANLGKPDATNTEASNG